MFYQFAICFIILFFAWGYNHYQKSKKDSPQYWKQINIKQIADKAKQQTDSIIFKSHK